MTGFNPYITFKGNCEKALTFYKSCFDGEVVFIQYYEDVNKIIPHGQYSKVMHSEFKAEAIHFMACDATPGQTIQYGTNITLYIDFSTVRRLEEVFEKLSVNGTVPLALEKTLWGSRLGIITDQFNIHWMLVCNK
jgi:PhnB protein